MGIRSFAAILLVVLFCSIGGVPAAADDIPCFSMQGCRGREIYEAKEKLYSLGYFDGKIDDCFDAALFSALLAYQETHGMRKTGILSAGVLSALGIQEEAGAVSEADFLTLCDFLADVCGGKSYVTVSYVASAVMNRVKDPRFEDGIAAAVYALRQAAGIPASKRNTEPPEFLLCRTAYDALRCGAAFPGVYFFLPAHKASGLFAKVPPVFSFEGLDFYGDQDIIRQRRSDAWY